MTRSDGRGLRTSPAPWWMLGLLALLLSVVAVSSGRLPWWATTRALAVPLVAALVLGRYPLVSLGLCAVASVAAGLGMDNGVPVWSVALAVASFVVSLPAGRRIHRSAPALVVVLVAATLAVPLAIAVGRSWETGFLLLVLTVVLPFGLGRSIRQQSELAAAAVGRAQLEERTRIAHDMHDTLGHELSLLALRAGVLEIDPEIAERHRAAIAELRAGAGQATERLAEIVDVLRGGEPDPARPVRDSVDDLV
ncbi:MAG: histidine kinase, partial [Actinocatenispora sp.]